jgi:hypothetical protein
LASAWIGCVSLKFSFALALYAHSSDATRSRRRWAHLYGVAERLVAELCGSAAVRSLALEAGGRAASVAHADSD